MTNFDKSLEDLRKFFKEKGFPEPYSTVGQIIQALNKALNLNPEISNGDATLLLRSVDVFCVQQFVTTFGCHLEYRHHVDDLCNKYEVVPNWKSTSE